MPVTGKFQYRRSRLPYLLAVLGVGLASLLVWRIPLFVEHGAYGLFLMVVTLATWFGGWRPGLLAIALTMFTTLAFPGHPFSLLADHSAIVRIATFLTVAGLTASLHASRERALSRAWLDEQRLAFVLDRTQVGAWYSDLNSGKVWWSQTMERLFGRAPGEFSGTYESFIGYIHPDDQDFVKRAITRTVEDGREFTIAHRVVWPNGQSRRIVTRGRIIYDEDGRPSRILGLASDETEPREGTQPHPAALAEP